MKILNIHGYKGSAENTACTVLRKLGHEVISPQIDYDVKNPYEILDDLRKMFDENKPDYLTGTSLGGFFALFIAEITGIPAVLINPCLKPSVTLSELSYKADDNWKTALLKIETIIEAIDCNNVIAILGEQDEIISYHDYTKMIIKNHYIVPDGKHSGATLNLYYWFRELIK